MSPAKLIMAHYMPAPSPDQIVDAYRYRYLDEVSAALLEWSESESGSLHISALFEISYAIKRREFLDCRVCTPTDAARRDEFLKCDDGFVGGVGL